MAAKGTYDSIGRAIHLQCTLDYLSEQDRVQLFQQLLIDLGIDARFSEESDETTRAQQIIVEQYDKHWRAK